MDKILKMMKTITLILTLPLLLFSLSNCGGTQNRNTMNEFVQNPPFKIVESYTQDWVAGVEEGGKGTNVHIVFSEMDADVVIQNIYFKNHILEAKGNVNEPNEYVGYLRNDAKSDVIMDADSIKESKNTPSEVFPFKLEADEAVVEYWYAGKKNYYKISKLSEKNSIPYPQSKPSE